MTHKSGGIVIFDGLGISKCLKNGISLEQLVLKFTLQKTKHTY